MEDCTKTITETRKITELTTPVSTELAERFLSLLTQHGAIYEKGEDCSEGYGDAYFYRITFPPGTERYYGLMLYSAQPFDIHFPDGFILHGIDQHTTSGNREILFLPKERPWARQAGPLHCKEARGKLDWPRHLLSVRAGVT